MPTKIYKRIKAFFDFSCALSAIILLSPLFLVLYILLLLSGEGYVFYLQERIGFKNQVFKIIKFATMLKNSPNMAGGYITYDDDPRFTPLGKFLRKTKINELPQLINVLKGQMSVVGPRPLLYASFDAYPIHVQNVVYNVKPGLTGIGSIIFRDEQHIITQLKNEGKDIYRFYNETIFPHKGELEIWYQNNISFWTDFKIILLTAWVIIFPKSTLIYRIFASLPKRPF